MLRAGMQRPSLFVGTWTVLVVGVFVWRGDLRLAHTAPPESAPAARTRDVVRAPSPRAVHVATVARKGRIFDALGFLIVGAEVVPMERAPTRTDGDGTFQLDLAEAATTDVLVRADGQAPAWLRVSEGSPDVLALQLVPAAPWDAPPAPPAPVSPLRGEGTIRLGDGSPLGAAFVTAVGTGVWARTDDIGRFVMPLPVPSALLCVHEPNGGAGGAGFASLSPPIVNQRARGAVPLADLVAAPALAIRGIVRDAKGKPVVGLPIAIAGPSLRRVVDTGSGGAFRAGGLLPGRYQVSPFSWRGAVGVATDVALGDASLDLDVHLVAAEEVRLRVVDEHGGPVAGVYVASSVGGARRGLARADGDGFAAVPVSARTEFDVRTPQEFAPVSVRRYETDAATLVVALP